MQNMSATSNDSPAAVDMSLPQWPQWVLGMRVWGQTPHDSTYMWPSWPHVLPGMGPLPPTDSLVYT
jgi:hypothetical protein